MRTVQATRKYKTWTAKDDALLMKCMKEKISPDATAELLGRTKDAIYARRCVIRARRGEKLGKTVRAKLVYKKPEAKPVMTTEQEKEALRKLDERKAAKVAVFQKEPVTELMQEIALMKRDINRVDYHIALAEEELRRSRSGWVVTFIVSSLAIVGSVLAYYN